MGDGGGPLGSLPLIDIVCDDVIKWCLAYELLPDDLTQLPFSYPHFLPFVLIQASDTLSRCLRFRLTSAFHTPNELLRCKPDIIICHPKRLHVP